MNECQHILITSGRNCHRRSGTLSLKCFDELLNLLIPSRKKKLWRNRDLRFFLEVNRPPSLQCLRLTRTLSELL